MAAPRIISGTAKGTHLQVAAGTTRPMTDRIKTSVFDILTPYLKDTYVADLYAGSGALGLEALSRGAARASFVDNDEKAVQCIKANIEKTRFQEKAAVFKQTVHAFAENNRDKYDIVFCDPPFPLISQNQAPTIANLNTVMHQEGIGILRYPTTLKIDDFAGLKLLLTKDFGESRVVFLRK